MNLTQRHKLLIANRGEIAIRIAQAAFEIGIPTVGVFAEDDFLSLHIRKTTENFSLKGTGVSAYLDQDQLIQIAIKNKCTMIHPGYGFLSENASFAQQCIHAGLIFVGPQPEVLSLLGNKVAARNLAAECEVPIIPGTSQSVSLNEAIDFFESSKEGNALMIKAEAGGGGRGMRVAHSKEELKNIWETCRSEALKAFGSGDLYVEEWIPSARHIEVQILGDGTGLISHLGERECSIQRRNQKLIEIAPSPGLNSKLRGKLIQSGVKMAQKVNFASVGTFEFLVKGDITSPTADFYFIEANPRIQVEHTITEEISGVDLVQFQLQQALGKTLKELKLVQPNIPEPSGMALQLRINMESQDDSGNFLPSTGRLTAFSLPSGKGIRVDTFGYVGYENSPRYDSLLAKLICKVNHADFSALVKKATRAISECQIEGIETNLQFLHKLLMHSDLQNGAIDTQWVDRNRKQWASANIPDREELYFKLEQKTPEKEVDNLPEIILPEGTIAVSTSMPGSLVKILVKAEEQIQKGQPLAIIEAMKMESVLLSAYHGRIQDLLVQEGDVLRANQSIMIMEIADNQDIDEAVGKEIDIDFIRPDLAELYDRQVFTQDEARPEAIAKRRKYGQNTARENIDSLCDDDSFHEYGSLLVAAQRKRRKEADLIRETPADGLVAGFGSVNGSLFSKENAQCLVMAYDFTVLAGTQGAFNHMKMDRMLRIVKENPVPVILFAEGGGGRPGDIDFPIIAGLDVNTFALFAQLKGKIPRIAIVSRYCFAGNAALAGCADVLIATKNTSIGMGGPAMIEGGGLGKYHPKDVGPVSFQTTNGVIDILVADETEAIESAKKYLSYFQGNTKEWTCEDQRLLRQAIPENRRRVYEIRNLINLLADTNSVLELRKDFGKGMITALIRIEGRPMGLIANNPKHLGGAIDSEGAEKAEKFMQMCNDFGLPILSLCDTPGIMVGPDAEKTGTVRHASQLFLVGSNLTVPFFTIVTRKGYGLGAMTMAGGSFDFPFFTLAWPTGEFGAMGLEGAVRLGYRKELEQAKTQEEQAALFEKMVAKAYEKGKALNAASFFEIDEVIDPSDSRKRIVAGLDTCAKSR